MKRHVILLGPPGSGKGTVAQKLESHFHLEHVSTGDWFRHEIELGTELGKKVSGYLARGELVPDDVVLELIDHFMTPEMIEHGYLFDGFPRTRTQAEKLDHCCEEKHAPIDAVIFLNCPEAIVVDRIIGRRVCPQCRKVYHVKNMPPRIAGKCDACGSELVHRSDDTEEVVKKRLQQYRESTAPLVEYYEQSRRLVTVNSGPGADVFEVTAHLIEE